MSSSALEIRKFVTPEIVFGKDSRLLVGQFAKQFSAKKVLIVTDPGVIQAGWLKDIQISISNEGIESVVYSNVSSNPRETEVAAGAEFYLQNNCDVIVSIGGGSPMDCAKGIGIVAVHRKGILSFEGVDKVDLPVPPMIFIPTTAGTSADVSQFCIISNQKEKVKIAIVSKSVVPDISLIDPLTTTSMDSYLTACTGIDALVHSIEAFVSKGAGPLTDSYALEAIDLIIENLPELIKDINNDELRGKVMLASMKAGLAFSNAILGAVHAMSHSLGGYLDLPHGECNAILLEHVINYNFNSIPSKFRTIAKKFGINPEGLTDKQVKNKLIDAVMSLKKKVGISNKLSEVGVHKTDIPFLSRNAAHDACIITNPREASKEDIEIIYEEAL